MSEMDAAQLHEEQGTPVSETPEPVAAPEGDDTTGDIPDPEGADALRDEGKKALAAMKEKVKEERAARKALEARLAELERGAKEPAPTPEPDIEAVRKEAVAEALQAVNQRVLRAEIRAAAAGKLADPADALALLDMSAFEVDADGNVDADAIASAIDDLISKKPYLAAQGGRRFQGSADSGARNAKSEPVQLTREDLKGMSPDEILRAKQEGRLNAVLGIQ